LGSSRTVATVEGQPSPKAQQLLAVLKSAKDNSWKNIVTLNQFFFYLHTDFEQESLPRDEAPGTRERHMISSERLAAAIA
jgi:hypothetical protein